MPRTSKTPADLLILEIVNSLDTWENPTRVFIAAKELRIIRMQYPGANTIMGIPVEERV